MHEIDNGGNKMGKGFDTYDQDQLEKAKQLLIKLYEYNYGTPSMRQEVNRLETIIKKLEVLQNLAQ